MARAGVVTPVDGIASLPAHEGVAQILDRERRPLICARVANVRRWAITQLGPPKPPRPGKRPPTDLRPLAGALRHATAASTFEQRLVYERWMAETVPLSKRRDLKPPAYLHLDPRERFPRVTVRGGSPIDADHFGPFRDRRAADRALKPLHKRFPLRPCDFEFEPDPALPLGLNCLYAQVRSCAAPCLARVTEDEYRDVARRAHEFLARSGARPDDCEWLPAWAGAADLTGVIAERTRAGIALFFVRAGAVCDDDLTIVDCDALDVALARFADVARPSIDDRPWLVSFFSAPRVRAVYEQAGDGLASRLRARLA